MRIYIETDMNEMPKSCSECKRIERSKTMSNLGYCKDAESFRHWKDATTTVPYWCPLRTETEIADKVFAKCVVIQTISNPQTEDMNSEEAFQIIKYLAEQYGKEE